MYSHQARSIHGCWSGHGPYGPQKHTTMGHYMHHEAYTTHTICLTRRGTFTHRDITPTRGQSRALRPTHNGCLMLDRCDGEV